MFTRSFLNMDDIKLRVRSFSVTIVSSIMVSHKIFIPTYESLNKSIPQDKSSLRGPAWECESVPNKLLHHVLKSLVSDSKFHPPSHHAGGSEPGGPAHTEPACIQFIGDN